MKYEVERNLTWIELISGALVTIFLFIVAPGIADHIETHYTKKDCVIVEITEEYIVAKDIHGDEWSWYIDGTDLVVDDVVDLKMYNGHTDRDWADDEVIKVKYSKKTVDN